MSRLLRPCCFFVPVGAATLKVEELDSKLTSADAALKEREEALSKTIAEKELATAAEKSSKEELEVKVGGDGYLLLYSTLLSMYVHAVHMHLSCHVMDTRVTTD